MEPEDGFLTWAPFVTPWLYLQLTWADPYGAWSQRAHFSRPGESLLESYASQKKILAVILKI